MSSCISYHKPLLLIAVHSSNLSKSRKKHQTCYTSTCDPHTFRMKLNLWCTNIMISHLLTVEGEENSCQHQSLCQYEKQHRLFCSETPCVNACSLFFNSTFLYLKFLVVWALVLLADFVLEFRFEYLWPFWLFIRSVYDSFRYQGLVSVYTLSLNMLS